MHMGSDKTSIHIPISEKCYYALSRAVYFDKPWRTNTEVFPGNTFGNYRMKFSFSHVGF